MSLHYDTLLLNCMKSLFEDIGISEHLFSIAISDPNLNRQLSEVITEFEDIRKNYKVYCNRIAEKEIHVETLDFQYIHKCNQDAKSELKESGSDVELMDLENVFVEVEEPVSKKAKISGVEIETLVSRLEKDVSSLTQLDMTDSYKNRISSVCQKLNELISSYCFIYMHILTPVAIFLKSVQIEMSSIHQNRDRLVFL